jgi:oligoendopeptidase F
MAVSRLNSRPEAVASAVTSMDASQIERDYEEFSKEALNEYYQNWAGLKEELNISQIFMKYSRLFTPDNIAMIKRTREASSGDEHRRSSRLFGSLVDTYLGQQVSQLTDKATTLQTQTTITVCGKSVPYRSTLPMIMNENERARRDRINALADEAVETFNHVLEERLARLHEAARAQGYSDYASLYSELKSIDYEKLLNELKARLKPTDALYTEQLKLALRSIGVKLRDANRHDILYIYRGKKFDSYFPKEKVVMALRQTINGMGLQLEKYPNITLDLEERPKKDPRAACFPLDVPRKIIFGAMPIGGRYDYETILHEAGHALHHANTPAEMPFVFRLSDEKSLTETYSSLFENLTLNQKWLQQVVGVGDARELLDFAYFSKLYLTRLYVAKLEYELRLHREGIQGKRQLYKDIHEQAVKVRINPVNFLINVDDGFYCAEYLRSWIAEAQLRKYLVDEFGDEWFANPGSGGLLMELWKEGSRITVEELAERLGQRFDPKFLYDEIREHFE